MKVNLLQKNKISRFFNVVKCTLDIPRVNMLSEIGYWRLMRVETVLAEGGMHQEDMM